MEYIYAALLLHKAGKEINEKSVKSVLTGAGVAVDEARVKALVAALQNVNIDEAMKKAATPIAVAAVASAAPAAGSEKKEEKKKEEDGKKAEEAAAAGLSALFG